MTDRDTSDRPDDPGSNQSTDSKSPTGGFISAIRGQANPARSLVTLVVIMGLVIGAPLLVGIIRGGGIRDGAETVVGLVSSGLGLLADFIEFIPNFAFGLGGGLIAGILLIALFWIFVLFRNLSDAQDEAEGGNGRSVPWTDRFKAAAAAAGLFAAWWFRDLLISNRWLLVAIGGLVLLYFVLSVFFEESRERRNTSTAISRTSSRVSDSVEELSATVVGSALVILSAGTAAIAGGFAAIGTLDQFISPLLDELGFVFVTLIGYVQLGGNLPFSGYIPSMNAGQWLGFSLVIGALVLVFRDN